MYIIIVGLGGIGKTLAALAVERGDNVVIIDRDEDRCSEMLERYDLLAITGNATNSAILEDAGIERADALVATTSDDSVNLMTCWIAKRMKVANVVSIVNQQEHADMFSDVGVTISQNPDELVATRLYFWAENPQLQQLASLPGGTIFEIQVENGAFMIDHEIREMKVKDFVFIAIRRQGGELIIPNGAVKFRPDDVITVFTKKDAEKECLKTLNKYLKEGKPGTK